MFALEAALKDGHGLSLPLRNAVFGFGVMLIDVDWDVETPEMPSAVVCDRMGFRNGQAVGRYLERLIEYWRTKRGNPVRLDDEQLSALRQKLRPSVDVYPPFSARVGIASNELLSLTEEQYERLEVVDGNARVVVSGGAGTGKTFLMLQCARREVALGRRVLVVVESQILAAHLSALERLERLSIHSYAEIEAGQGPRDVDVLLVDEGQDLLFMDAFVVLAGRLRGGLDEGRWRWFMDDNRQSGISGRREEDAARFLSEGLTSGTPTRVTLTRNCRNTREIIETVEAWTGAHIGRATLRDSLGSPTIHEYESSDSLAVEVSSVVDRLLEDGVEADEIAIIHPVGASPFSIAALSRPLAKRCVPLDVNTVRAGLRARIVLGAVDLFKGLERPVVMAVGFDSTDFIGSRVSELYVAVTRGNFSLHLFVSPKVARELRKRTERAAD
jgi:superfamily I DNA/RNA helicase